MKFEVSFHPKAYKEAQSLVKMNPDSGAKFREYIELLSTNPYQFPKKYGKLKECRSCNFGVGGDSWRLVFIVLEDQNIVKILAVGAHDRAYSSAQRRI